MRKLSTVTCGAALSLALLAGLGCESDGGGGGVMSDIGSTLFGGGDTSMSAALARGAGLAQAAFVRVLEERPASEEEQKEAKSKASKQLEPVSAEERQDLKDKDTYVAVPVGQTDEGQKEVMVVDPVTGEPASDKVYVVDSSDPNVADGSKVDLGGYDAVYVE